MRTRLVFCTALTVAIGTFAPAVWAQDPNAARNLAASCSICHGTNGISVNNIPPSLAGMNKDVLLQTLKDFKEGRRTGTIMHQHAKGYTDQQLELIAGYFAAVKPAATPPSAIAPAARGGY
jgi:cytochrome c553